jgi:hypothetical protein
MEWKPLSIFDFGYRIDVIRNLDPNHGCVDGSHILNTSNPCGFLASNLLFAWDESDPKSGKVREQGPAGNPITVDTTHYGNKYGILALEQNRTESFHSDLNLNPMAWLTLGGSFNSGYQHTWTPAEANSFGTSVVEPSHFEANMNNDVRFTSGVNLSTLLAAFKSLKQKLDAYRVRSLDATYDVSNKFNGEAFTYSYLVNNGVSYSDFLAYQLGFIYNLHNLGTLFHGEPNPRFFDYLSVPDPALTENNMYHVVNRTVNLQSGFSVPQINLDLTGSLMYSNQYTLYRDFQPSDTTVDWPDYTLAGTFNDLTSKFPFLKSRLKTLTAYTNYNYKHESTVDLFNPSPNTDKTSYIANPLLRLSATTLNQVHLDVSFDASYVRAVEVGKDAGTNSARPLTYQGEFAPSAPIYLHDDTLDSPEGTLTLGVEPAISYDVQTQKGIQFWKYYIKLQNSLRLTLASSLDYTLDEITSDGITTRNTDHLAGMVKPEADYNFTNNVDAKFWFQYNYDLYYNTPEGEYTNTIEIHGEFTMRF